MLQGGATIGALTLTRWYSAHVIFLPGAAGRCSSSAHLVLMRRQGISGPVRAARGLADAVLSVAGGARRHRRRRSCCSRSRVLAWRGMPALEGPADPTDATYIPRPEWYFLGLFQLLKYFPGKLGSGRRDGRPDACSAALLALLPWIDRGPDRDPRRRRVVMLGVAGRRARRSSR